MEVAAASVPEGYSRKLPKSSRLPAAKLARLAVDTSSQGQGYGALLLADAIKRIVLTTKESGGATGFFVGARDEKAQRFCLRFGFIPFADDPLRLFLPLNTLAKGLEITMTA